MLVFYFFSSSPCSCWISNYDYRVGAVDEEPAATQFFRAWHADRVRTKVNITACPNKRGRISSSRLLGYHKGRRLVTVCAGAVHKGRRANCPLQKAYPTV